MTPQFAKAIDPIFLYTLELMTRITEGQQPSAHEERSQIRALIDQGAASVPGGESWELAKYAMVSWIDDLLVNSPWKDASWWQDNVMEVELFNTRLCFQQFFVNAQRAATLSSRDALEVYYLCGILGFRGLYADPQTAAAVTQRQGLPADFPSWAHQVAMSIRVGHDRPEHSPPVRELYGAPPLKNKARVVWPWLVASMLAVLNAIYYLWTHA